MTRWSVRRDDADDGRQLTACGPDVDEIRVVEHPPKAKTPHGLVRQEERIV